MVEDGGGLDFFVGEGVAVCGYCVVFVIVVVIVVVMIVCLSRLVEVGVAFVERSSTHHMLSRRLVALEICLLALAELVDVHGLRESFAGRRCAGSSVDAVWVRWRPGFAGVCTWSFSM